MATFTVVITESPYARLNALTGLRFATQALEDGHKVNVFFVQDGVHVPVRALPTGLPDERMDIRGWLEKVIKAGAQLKVCGFCAEWRGLKQEDYLQKARLATMHDLVEWVRESDRVITF